jgi:hypothetical protein
VGILSLTKIPDDGRIQLQSVSAGLRAQGSGLRAQGSGHRAQGSGRRTQDAGLRGVKNHKK